MKPTRILEILLWVGVLGFVGYRLGPQLGAALGLGSQGERVIAGAIPTLDGPVLSPADLEGAVLLVNVWATWCGPCVLEMPGFQRVYDEFRDQGFLVLGVSRDRGDPERVRAFLREKGITYPVAMATEADLGGLAEVTKLPTSFLVDREGRVRHTVTGLYLTPALRMAVRRLLAEGRPAHEAPSA